VAQYLALRDMPPSRSILPPLGGGFGGQLGETVWRGLPPHQKSRVRDCPLAVQDTRTGISADCYPVCHELKSAPGQLSGTLRLLKA
jgi:hypothetical protein